MHKHIAIAAIVLACGLCAAVSPAAEIIMPGAAIGAGADIDAPTHEDAITGTGIRGSSGSGADAARRHLQPDTAAGSHVEGNGRAGVDDGSAELNTKSHLHGRWQSLLPGAMK